MTAFTTQKHSSNSTAFRCILSCDKEVYKIGELPKLTVKIYNDTKEDIHFIGSLDGSDVKWRYPYCYYTMERPKADKAKLGRCGNMNPLRMEDFKLVKSGQDFDPYERTSDYGFFSDYITTSKETFKSPGIYKLKFHYSTNSLDIQEFMGDKPFGSNYSDSLKMDTLFKTVPKVDLVSNEVIFRVEK